MEGSELIKITVDGKEVEVTKGTRLIEAARKVNEDVPYYCYHPGLSIAGNCRMCLVEVEGMPKLQIACHTEARDGMIVETKNEKVLETRKHILEFLLINHPVDCPVCDQAGECWLQDYYMKHGLYDSRLNENKIKKPKAVPLGPTVMLDAERCILCSRCIRFTDEISKTHELGIVNRGDHSEIGVFPGKELNNPYSGNVVDICPVGALTDRDFRFKIRTWYLKSGDSICTGCSRGCNIQVHYNLDRPHHGKGRVKRLKPRFNAEINQWWICDEGRYGYKFHDENRLTAPKLKGEESSWPVLTEELVRQMNENSSRWQIVLSPRLSNEEIYAVKVFVRQFGMPKPWLISEKEAGFQDDFLICADKHPNRKGAELLGFVETESFEALFKKNRNEISGLIVFGHDLTGIPQSIPVVFIGSNETQLSAQAGYVLPAATTVEKSGTLTNCDGKTQVFDQVLEPLEQALSEIEILNRLLIVAGKQGILSDAGALFSELASNEKPFSGMSYEALRTEAANVRTQSAPTIPALEQYDNIL